MDSKPKRIAAIAAAYEIRDLVDSDMIDETEDEVDHEDFGYDEKVVSGVAEMEIDNPDAELDMKHNLHDYASSSSCSSQSVAMEPKDPVASLKWTAERRHKPIPFNPGTPPGPTFDMPPTLEPLDVF